ncbi:unnamed protein product [Brassica rapa subsp. narinosa]
MSQFQVSVGHRCSPLEVNKAKDMEEESNVSSSPSTRLRHRKQQRSSSAEAVVDDGNPSPLLVNDQNKYKSFMVRTYSTIWMIGGFVMVVYMGHLYITAMVLVIQIFMAKELFNLLRKAPEEKCLPGIKHLNWRCIMFLNSSSCWHFFFTAMLFVYGRILSQRLANTVTADQFLYRLVSGLIKYHMAICYLLYIIGFMWFILTLKKKMYKYQFGQYAWTHMILIVVFTQSSFTVANIFEGIFWFLLPASLIITTSSLTFSVSSLEERP